MSSRHSGQKARKPAAKKVGKVSSRRHWMTSTNLTIDLILCLGHISAVATIVAQHFL